MKRRRLALLLFPVGTALAAAASVVTLDDRGTAGRAPAVATPGDATATVTAGPTAPAQPSPTPAATPTPMPTHAVTTPRPTPRPTAPPAPVPAPTLAPPPPPAPVPAPDPNVMFADDFHADALGAHPDDGWHVAHGNWLVKSDGGNRYLQMVGAGEITHGSNAWHDYSVTVSIWGTHGSVLFRLNAGGSYYGCGAGTKLALFKHDAGAYTMLAMTPITVGAGWHQLTVTAHGQSVSCRMGGVGAHATDSAIAAGGFALAGEGGAQFDSVSVRRVS